MKIEISNNSKWNASLTIKMGVLVFLGILFLIPLQMIILVINERQKNSEKVRSEISDQWAIRQVVSGPVLNVPVKSIPKNKEEAIVSRVLHILPEQLEIKAEINPEIRHRGIYKAVVYNSHIDLKGDFVIPAGDNNENSEILWKEAYYTLGISDNRGIKGNVKMAVDSTEYEAVPGVKDIDLFKSGITFIPLINDPVKGQKFSISFNLSGSEGLFFIPVGKTTKTRISSSWNSPSFAGRFLPSERTINSTGFNAYWLITNLNRNFPQSWTGSDFNISDFFGVDLFLPVDHYQKASRCAKYGLLFIALTFMVLIFLELTSEEKIHIFNYFLVALALALFFSLLLALSEHIGFSPAYFLSSSATIVLLSFFTRSLFTKKNTVFIIAGLLVLLYAFIYIILSLNDFAFLAGNVGLFILLAVVMTYSGRINLFKREEMM